MAMRAPSWWDVVIYEDSDSACTRRDRLTTAVIMATIFALWLGLVVFCHNIYQAKMAVRADAFQIWMSDCAPDDGRSACATAWAETPTLRKTYMERVTH